MRLLVLGVLALAGWVAAAPGSLGSKDDNDAADAVEEDLQQEPEGDNLAPALGELARRKRGSSKANLPYSKYRPSGGMHRYRYPLYRKRSSYRPQPAYDYEDEVILPEVENDYYSPYEDQFRGPSLFRERSLQQERKKKEMLMEDDGYFSDDYVPERKVLPTPFVMPLKKKKDSVYNLANTPYDLHTMGRMYEMGKNDEPMNPYEFEGLNQVIGIGRKSAPRMATTTSPTEQFYGVLDSIKRKNTLFDDHIINPSEAEKLEQLINLKNILSSAAASRYLRGYGVQGMNLNDPMIRRKRDIATAAAAITPKVVTKVNGTATHKTSTSTPAKGYPKVQVSGDRRRKRAFNDYFNWERKALESEYEPLDKRDNNKEFNDYLTREYFKSIARSVGQKKKRMTYAQFEADKRSSGLDEFLENPAMLEYMQEKLREAEEEVAMEAEKDLGQSNTEELLSNIVVRLDALERMREALSRLQELQEEEEEETGRPQRALPRHLSGVAKKRQSSSRSSSGAAATAGAAAAPVAAASRRWSDENKKNNLAVNRRGLRRLRRGDGEALSALFLGNTKEECPVLDRVLLNCVGVSEIVGDQDEVFLESCIRHEVCYMCGSGLSVSGHECNAILSSSLEAACSRNLDCLSAAGATFNLLSNSDRYDDEGTCTHDPCVRQFLESR